MKRIIVVCIAIIMIMTTSITFGGFGEKVDNHWSRNMLDKSFIAYYFPYLAKNNFEKLDPRDSILEKDFNLSLASLMMEHGFEISGLGTNMNISRKDMVKSLGRKLVEIGVENQEEIVTPFKDINTLDSNSIELLGLLYKLGIIEGDSKTNFSPERKLSQAEAIIILQRVKGVLEDMMTVAFDTLGIVESYNNQEEILVKEQGDKLLVTITKQFGTPGYSMSVNKVMRDKNGNKIYLNIVPPSTDTMLPQVITYKTLTMEMDKNYLKTPYKFTLVVE